MRLSAAEFNAMNSRARRVVQRCVEWPLFKRLGLKECGGRDVVEIGCGSGYGGWLISSLGPRSYVGLDVMPEQIAIAERLGLPNARFLSADATRVAALGDTCADFVVIFGILHHVEAWPQAVAECRRLLRPGGILLVEEPDASLLRGWDRVFRWDHPRQGFSLAGLERELDAGGLTLERRLALPGAFGIYRARKAPGARRGASDVPTPSASPGCAA